MINNVLIQVLSKFDRKKLTRFKEFVDSPYFNKHKDVRMLVDYLSCIFPNFTDKKCHRETIYSQLFPTLLHDQKKIAIIFTYTTRLLDQFLIEEESRTEDKLESNKKLLQALSKPIFSFYLEKKWKEIINGVEYSANIIDSSQIANLIVLLDKMDKASMSIQENQYDFLDRKQAVIDDYFITEKLRDACELYLRHKLKGETYHPSTIIESYLAILEENPEKIQLQSASELYYHAFKMLSGNNTNAFDQLKYLLAKDSFKIAQKDKQTIYLYLQNFCIGQINSGNNNYLIELLNIYRSQLLQNLLISDGVFPEWHYKNIVTTGLRLDEYDWVKSFIEKYKLLLREDVRENAYGYNLATYYYHLNKFDEVLNLLIKVEYTDLRYNLDAKSLLLRTYYELEEENALFALADAFRHFLKRNKSLNEFQKNGYYNLLSLTRSAFKLKTNKGLASKTKWTKDLKKLKERFAEKDTIFNKSWIEDKINELD